MPQFTVPQFIEREPKIFGPFTFKQFVYVGIAGAICFILYFVASFQTFILACIVLGGGALALAFVKIGGQSLPVFLVNFLKFKASAKLYLWRKKDLPPRLIMKKMEPKKEKVEEELPLKIAEKSRLKKLSTQIETKQ